ncbi:tetratricopeptide repeat protein [Pseudoflavitalea rhizosphaerae]|uniref:tetratricopeptide repeat protein n=1 Tax=Pseudoflavitalea rhizosphaerae TaxID=1884793 RepID=UPI001F49BFC5|nr:hypothetical protein [Pseudoflavitalea rhizosphaerae]
MILLLSHFLIGPLRLVQEYMEAGDIEGAQRVVNSVKFPGLLIKPVRSAYFTIKGQLEMANQNFDAAEASMKKGMSLTTKMTADMKGANFLQMGMISLQKGEFKQGEKYIREALRAGINDKESEAVAYLQMCNIMMNKREFRAAKDYFRKTKALKPTNPEVVGQIKEIEKYIARIPG